eukprot:gnl/MRDRNA2_/MRDRNA2_150958_c0_seq1.p1 gnl/MRDRNA2_/MRDRNA2_150958_c0~~gnl/MRDRNA2_/MRDRNA2_150958_c0_seq1.p1  ORF type:complete len:778 (-),score=144.62 gnl/MRDRNA2_/MRDRNA2_150958_c0_seq1:12-2255(-)
MTITRALYRSICRQLRDVERAIQSPWVLAPKSDGWHEKLSNILLPFRKRIAHFPNGLPLAAVPAPPLWCDQVRRSRQIDVGGRIQILWKGTWYVGTTVALPTTDAKGVMRGWQVQCDVDPAGVFTWGWKVRPVPDDDVNSAETVTRRQLEKAIAACLRSGKPDDVDLAFEVLRALYAQVTLAKADAVNPDLGSSFSAQRLRGAILGPLLADSFCLGSHYNYNAQEIRNGLPSVPMSLEGSFNAALGAKSWHPTKGSGDLTDYGDSALEALRFVAGSGISSFDPAAFAQRWDSWARSYSGYRCTALSERLSYRDLGIPSSSAGSHVRDLVMAARLPAILSLYSDEEALVNAARDMALVTHEHFDSLAAMEFVSRWAFRVLHHPAPVSQMDLADFAIEVAEGMKNVHLKHVVHAAVHQAKLEVDRFGLEQLGVAQEDKAIWCIAEDPRALPKFKSSEAIPAIATSVYLATKYPRLEAAMQANMLLGGDSACRAHIIGTVLGAREGEVAMSSESLKQLKCYEEVCGLLDSLVPEGAWQLRPTGGVPAISNSSYESSFRPMAPRSELISAGIRIQVVASHVQLPAKLQGAKGYRFEVEAELCKPKSTDTEENTENNAQEQVCQEATAISRYYILRFASGVTLPIFRQLDGNFRFRLTPDASRYSFRFHVLSFEPLDGLLGGMKFKAGGNTVIAKMGYINPVIAQDIGEFDPDTGPAESPAGVIDMGILDLRGFTTWNLESIQDAGFTPNVS